MVTPDPHHDLTRNIDTLTRRAQIRRTYPHITNGKLTTIAETLTGPSLLAELADAVHTGTERSGKTAFTSRPPITIDALDLWYHITHHVNTWATNLGIDRNKYLHHRYNTRNRGIPEPPLARLLRAIAATAPGRWNPTQYETAITDTRTWATTIRVMLHEQEQRGVRGLACIRCGTTWVVRRETTAHGCTCGHPAKPHDHVETFREPAIVAATDPKREFIAYIRCRECGADQTERNTA